MYTYFNANYDLLPLPPEKFRLIKGHGISRQTPHGRK